MKLAAAKREHDKISLVLMNWLSAMLQWRCCMVSRQIYFGWQKQEWIVNFLVEKKYIVHSFVDKKWIGNSLVDSYIKKYTVIERCVACGSMNFIWCCLSMNCPLNNRSSSSSIVCTCDTKASKVDRCRNYPTKHKFVQCEKQRRALLPWAFWRSSIWKLINQITVQSEYRAAISKT